MADVRELPWARGESFYNGGTIDLTNIGGINLEGKEYPCELNAADDEVQSYVDGRPLVLKVVRNHAGVNLKPARIAHFEAATTNDGYETAVDGYCIAAASRPAGIVDEFLPAAGVPPNDLFYLVVQGPSKVTNQTGSPITTTLGARLVPAATGATAGDDLGGRVDLQSNVIASATTDNGLTISNAIQNQIGFADAVNSTTAAVFAAVVDLRF